MAKKRVNILTGFINPFIFSKIKSRIGLNGGLDCDDILTEMDKLKKRDIFLSNSTEALKDDDSDLFKTIKKSRQYLLSQQNPDGHWVGVLEANTTLTSEYIFLMHFMDMIDDEKIRKAANYILSKQSNDGSWPIYFGGKGDISTTVEAYFALKLAGYNKNELFMKKARDFILKEGGVVKARVITKITLTFFGQMDPRLVPSLPVEMIFIPRLISFNIYEFSSWARICVVPLTVLMELKPKIKIKKEAGVEELFVGSSDKTNFSFSTDEKHLSWRNFFVRVDGVLKLVEKSPIKISKKIALKKAKRWILSHQDDSGDWGGIFPAMGYSIMALKMLGYSNNSSPIKKGFEAIERFALYSEDSIHMQSCVSPVWDTAWSMYALNESGISGDRMALKKAAKWLYSKQTKKEGDWKIKNPGASPGGWSFEYYNEFYPDADDTAAVIMALMNVPDMKGIDKSGSIRKGLQWVMHMQNTDGGWGAFDKDVDNPVYNEIIFNDLKSMLDPSTPDVTGRVVELLGALGYNSDFIPVMSALKYLKKEQLEDGAWFGRWGVNYIYGTWAVLSGLASIGEDVSKEYIQRGMKWLFSVQNDDGGWGESCDSYQTQNPVGIGKSTPSQTAWALLGLMAFGVFDDERIKKGISFLIEKQLKNGSWKEEEFTGTGFPNAFYIRYHMYKDYFPLQALSKYRRLSYKNGLKGDY